MTPTSPSGRATYQHADDIYHLIDKGAALCAETAATVHGFTYFLEPGGQGVPTHLARRLIATGYVTCTTPGLLPCCPGMTWERADKHQRRAP